MRWMVAAVVAIGLCGPASAAMTITSADFKDGDALPPAHVFTRCGGQNVSPQLSWTDNGAAQSYVLTMIDVSVKPSYWSHWLIADLPRFSTALPRGVTKLPPPAIGLGSDFGGVTYNGPCPPPGSGTHRYEFTIWAMPLPSTTLPAPSSAKGVTEILMKTSLDHATIAATVTAK